MKSAEGAGRTVEEAIRSALRVLGARREDVDLMVLDEGSRGVLGLGSREARVRLTLLSESDEQEVVEPEAAGADAGTAEDAVPAARSIAASLLDAMGFRASIQTREEEGVVFVGITGDQLAPLIGRHGQTLEALELLVNLMTARRLGRRVPIVVDAERYRERRREALQALALRTAARVRRTKQSVALEPMSASERRVIHTALATSPDVTTHSEGQESGRHIVITPRTGAASTQLGARSSASGPSGDDDGEP
jgi:spoIIIJ-associated protein